MPPKPPPTLFQGTFHNGLISDTARHALPAGAVYDSTDYLLHRPGIAEKRGGWERHSALLDPEEGDAAETVDAVATIHIPTRVVAVADEILYDVTSENSPQATEIDACFAPGENPPLYGSRLIFCDNTATGAPGTDSPLQVYWDTTTIAVDDLFGGGLPYACRSIVHNSFVVLANDGTNRNRVWFWPDPDLEPLVDTAEVFIDVSAELISGLASVSGALLVFGPTSIERILGGVPPGRVGENMELQPLASVGTIDARSIVHVDEAVVFAGQEGVWMTNGAGVESLTKPPGRSGIQRYWESLFEPGEIRQVVGGLLAREFYIANVLDADNEGVATLLCHLPSRAWMPVANLTARMFARGRDEQENIDLYFAAAGEGYVNKCASMLRPAWANRADGDGTAIEPSLELVFGDAGVQKKIGQGRLTHRLTTTGAGVWAAETVYAAGDVISADGALWVASGGTSGDIEPDWDTAPDPGDTVDDG